MKVKMNAKFLGIERFRGRKDIDKVYSSGVFLQETETLKIFLQDGQEESLNLLKNFEDVEIELDISIGREKTYTALLSVRPLEKQEDKLKVAK